MIEDDNPFLREEQLAAAAQMWRARWGKMTVEQKAEFFSRRWGKQWKRVPGWEKNRHLKFRWPKRLRREMRAERAFWGAVGKKRGYRDSGEWLDHVSFPHLKSQLSRDHFQDADGNPK